MSNVFDKIQQFRNRALNEAALLPMAVRPYGIGINSAEMGERAEYSNDAFTYTYTRPTGLRAMTLLEAMSDVEISEKLFKYLTEKSLPIFTDRNFAESFANFGSGLVIVVEKGSDVTFEFSTMTKNSGSDFVVIIAEENSVLRVLENLKNENTDFVGRNIFVVVENNASVIFADSGEISNIGSLLSHKFSQVGESGKIEWFDLSVSSCNVRTLTEDRLIGNGAESYLHNMSLVSDERYDMYCKVHHEADATSSHIFARGIAGGNGKIVYRALSDIKSGVRGATGRQDGRFLITGSGAEVDAIPSLDIASSESNSSHALSISHLTDKDFFYPALRGITPYRAQAMLLSGFLAKYLEKLPETWQQKCLEKINKKLSSPLFRMGE